MIVYLSVGQILLIHRAQIEGFGGGAGLRDRGALEAAVARPAMTFGGDDLYPDLSAKAAALLHSLVMNHGFMDGNKRVGVMAAELFLEANDARLLATDEELGEVTMSIARGEMDAESLVIWFRQRVTREE